MKKSLIAVAVLAATTGAFAQSAVTLYGRLDLGMASNKNTSNAGGVGTPSTTSKTFSLAGAQGVRTGGRLGVRGTEDLGGGLKASFNIETNVNPDNSVNSDGFGTFGKSRQGNLSLAGGFGTITIGTFDNAFDDVRGYSASTGGVAGGDFLYINTGAAIDARSENSLGYRSPTFGGFHVRANVVNQKTAPGLKTSGFIAAAGYDNGPLSALLAIGNGKNVTSPTAATTDGKVRNFGFGVSYDLGLAVPYFQFEQTKESAIVGSGYDKIRAFEIGSKFPLGAFTPYITLSSGKAKDDLSNTGKIRGFQIGTTYDISKRTYVYGAIGSDKTTPVAAPSAAPGFSKNTGYALGLVHSF
jgi:predicted porin